MKPITFLLTYADGRNRKGQRLCASAREVGFDKIAAVSPTHLARTRFAVTHYDVLCEPRGGGYMTHRFLNAPRNLERLLRGEPARLAYGEEAPGRLGERQARFAPDRMRERQPVPEPAVAQADV